MKLIIYKCFTRKKGDIENIIYSLICITTCFVIITMGINYIGAAKEYLDANQIARKYLLKMETAGYLSPAVSSELVSEMKDRGFKYIGLSGTTLSKVDYGDDIYLQIAYMQKINVLTINGFNFTGTSKDTLIRITRSSTAKGSMNDV